MPSLRNVLANITAIAPALSGEAPHCRRCNDYGTVLVREPYIVAGKNWGDRDVERPCPDCSPTCDACDGKGVVRYDVPPEHELFGKLMPCRQCQAGKTVEAQMQLAALRKFELPAQYKIMTFATRDALPESRLLGKWLARSAAGLFVNAAGDGFNLSWHALHEAVGKVAPDGDTVRNSLVLSGPYGVGKTGLAAAILNALIHSELNICYARTADLISEVQGRYGATEWPKSTDVIQKYQTCDLLVLDEFNVAEPVQPDKQRIIEDVIRHRYNNTLATVVTCNLKRDEIERQWEGRTATALFAMAHWINMGGPALRNEGQESEVF